MKVKVTNKETNDGPRIFTDVSNFEIDGDGAHYVIDFEDEQTGIGGAAWGKRFEVTD